MALRQIVNILGGNSIAKVGDKTVIDSGYAGIDVNPIAGQELDSLRLEYSDITRVLGVEFDKGVVETTLNALGFTLEGDNRGWHVSIPYWRPDISIPEDLVEEIARIVGYDNIPTTILSGRPPQWQPQPEMELRKRVTDLLVQAGIRETINYSATTSEG